MKNIKYIDITRDGVTFVRVDAGPYVEITKDGTMKTIEESMEKDDIPFADEYPYQIILEDVKYYGEVDLLRAWCKSNNIDRENYRIYMGSKDFHLIFAFNNEDDAIAFKLRWI